MYWLSTLLKVCVLKSERTEQRISPEGHLLPRPASGPGKVQVWGAGKMEGWDPESTVPDTSFQEIPSFVGPQGAKREM